MPRRHRKMRGGFLDSLGTTLSGWGSSLSEGASSVWNKTKNATTSAYDSVTGSSSTTSYMPTTSSSSTSYTMGGRKRTKRHMRGGFTDNTPTTGLAAHASPISDIKTAQPHNWVGGKTKKHRKHRRHSKSKRHHRKH
jgi:hypothetical protein